ncbi:MAG: TonB-dependent receptor plug domain-containing protein [Armatimonadota bacterium]
MNRLQTWGMTLTACLLLAAPIWAEEAPKTDDQPEITVVVTAERTEQTQGESIATTTVITAKEIRQQGAQTVADVLRIVPGVTLRQSGTLGSLATISLRGTKPNQTLMLVDGQRVSSPAFFSGVDPSKFLVDDVERIEVIRGPVSSLYGSDAFGGVINVITKRHTTKGGETKLGFGENGREQRSLSVHDGNDLLNWQLTGALPQYDGFRPNSDFSASNINGRLTFPAVKGWELSLHGEHYQDTLGLPGADPFHTGYVNLTDHAWNRRDNIDLSAAREFGAGKLEWRAYRLDQEMKNVAPGIYDSTVTGLTKATELNYRSTNGAHQWLVGGEYRREEYTDVEGGYAPSTQQNAINNTALFAQDRWTIAPKTDLVLGARLDDHSTAGSKVTPRVGINREIRQNTFVRASYSEGFRAPNFVELYYPAGPWGPGYSGNPNLKPETSRQLEVGMNMVRGKDTLDIALFNNKVKDLIMADYANPYRNIATARQRGIELTWERRFSKTANLSLSYSYLNAIDETTDERLLGLPRNEVNLTVAKLVRQWDIALTGRWVDARPDLAFDPETFASVPVTIPPFAAFDLTFTRRGSERMNPYLVIRNLTNKGYEEVAGYRQEGRTFEIGLRAGW